MAVNKSFVIVNGLEVNTDLIFSDTEESRIGIASTTPNYTLDVEGGFGAIDGIVSGILTASNKLLVDNNLGVNTSSPIAPLDVRSASGVSIGDTALYVYGDLVVTGVTTVGSIIIDSGDLELSSLHVSGLSTFVGVSQFDDSITVGDNLRVAGVSTFVGVSTFNDSVSVGDNLLVAGLSTFTGVTTTGGNLFVGADLYIKDDLVVDELTGRNINITGIGTIVRNFITSLTVSGVSTFTGNVNVSATSILDVDGHTELDAVNVAGVSTYASDLDINAAVDILEDIKVGAAATVTGLLYTPSGNVDLKVAGISTFTGALDVNSTSNFAGNIVIGSAATVGLGNSAYLPDGARVEFGNSEDLQIYHSGSHSYIEDSGTGSLILNSNDTIIKNAADTETIAQFTEDAAVSLYYNNSKKFETTNTGAIVTGVLTATTFSGSGSGLTGIATQLSATIGVGSETTYVGSGVSAIYFATQSGTNVHVSTAENASTGITSATVTMNYPTIGLVIALGG